MKKCNQCNLVKSLEDFNKNIDRKDGRLERCKQCMSFNRKQRYENDIEYREKVKQSVHIYRHSKNGQVAIRKYRQSIAGKARDKRTRDNNPERVIARNQVGHQVRIYKMPPANSLICSCGNQAIQYHHHNGYEPDYWLDVIPVCLKCHQQLG